MNLNLKIIILLLLANVALFGQLTKNVLFLGNSYTYANDLPLMVSKLAQSTGDNLVYSNNTPGGYTLQGHSTNSASLNFIQQGGWDYVVLQDQSQRPSFPISQVMVEVFPYAASLSNTIVQYNPCAKPLFFMTWGRKYGDAGNCASWPPVCTYTGMDSLLNLRYRMMADSNDAYVSPVGAVWHYIRDNYSSIDLYSPDNSHPSLAGSYAAACTFYSLVFQKDPTVISDDYGLSASDAINIRNAAKIIAFDSLAKWNVGSYLPKAAFTINQTAATIQFSNQSQYSSDYLWYFGDGDSSTVFEPSHIYAQSGTYTTMLKVSKCLNTDTISYKITIAPDAINSSNFIKPILYPNPVMDVVNIKFDRKYAIKNISIHTIDGKYIKRYNSIYTDNLALDLKGIKSGLYFLSYEINNHIYQSRIVKIED